MKKRPGDVHQVLEPERLEADIGTQVTKFGQDRVVEALIAGHDNDRGLTMRLHGAQSVQQPEAVDERHAEIQDDGVRVTRLDLAEPGLGIGRTADLVAFESQNAGERLPCGIVVIDDEKTGGRRGLDRGVGTHD